MNRHIRLDLVGGIAGDMFVAAMLDAFPDGLEPCLADLRDSGVLEHVKVRVEQGKSHGLKAQRFCVDIIEKSPHREARYARLRALLQDSSLREPVKHRALSILGLLAEAESAVHGVALDDVHFHEVADWDSIADVVAASSLIEHSQAGCWSCGPVPLGSGLVRTEHGKLPVPAPATIELLQGFSVWDDGESGERVTPTGAAILKHVMEECQSDKQSTQKMPQGTLCCSGTGAGSRELDTRPNIVRCTIIEYHDDVQRLDTSKTAPHDEMLIDEVDQLSFAIDDMTPEELAIGAEHIRNEIGVIDVSLQMAMGKKGRALFNVVVLCQPSFELDVSRACFAQTSTLGIRVQRVSRRILRRSEHGVEDELGMATVKIAERPGHRSAKVASDDLQALPTLEARRKRAQYVSKQSLHD